MFIGFLFLTTHDGSFADTHFTSSLDGSQEVPPVMTPARGTASVTLTCDGTEAEFVITVEGLISPMTAAHFHNAPAGINGGVVRTLTSDFVGNTASGTWTSADTEPLTPALAWDLVTGNIYFNIRTGANPGGEIRGQVNLGDGIGFAAPLDGFQEVPPVVTPAAGTGTAMLTGAGLVFFISVEGLSGPITNAGFHNEAPGANGPVVRTIFAEFVGGNTAFGIWSPFDGEPLTDPLVGELLAGNIYFNIHTAANPAGEIRGQVNVKTGSYFTSSLDGFQEFPPEMTPATGTGSVELNGEGTEAKFIITVEGLSGPMNAAHFHNEALGVNGPVVRTITSDFAGNMATGVWTSADTEPLTPALVSELLASRIYFNIHTDSFPAGEIRGQVFPIQGISYSAPLDGSQEVPPAVTPATGTGTATLTGAGLEFIITVEGLSAPISAAHFHNEAFGANGPVVRTITPDFMGGNTASGVWTSFDGEPLTDFLVGELLADNIYFNIHSDSFPGGEIRGQLFCASTITGIEEGNYSTPKELPFALSQNAPNPFNLSTTIVFSLPHSPFLSLKIYDLLGRRVATLLEGQKSAGTYEVTFDGRRFNSGVYFYRLEAGGLRETRKMLLLH